jgi:hypothetical protein
MHVMAGVEAAQLELCVVGFGLRGDGEEALQELLMTGATALGKEFAGVVGIFEVAVSIDASGVAGDELVVVIHTEAVRITLEQ